NDDAVHDRNAEQRDEPDRRGDAERDVHQEQCKNAPDDRHRDDAHGQQRVDHRAEIDPEQKGDQSKRDRHYDLESPDRILQIAEFAHPFDPRTRRQLHLLSDLSLRLLDGAAEIAVAYAELEGQGWLRSLAVDVGGAGDELRLGALVERNLCIAVRSWSPGAKFLTRLGILSDRRREPYHDGEVPVAAGLVKVAGRF